MACSIATGSAGRRQPDFVADPDYLVFDDIEVNGQVWTQAADNGEA